MVTGEIIIFEGFTTWKKTAYANDKKLEEHRIKFICAGPQKDDLSQPRGAMQFPVWRQLKLLKTIGNVRLKGLGLEL